MKAKARLSPVFTVAVSHSGADSEGQAIGSDDRALHCCAFLRLSANKLDKTCKVFLVLIK